MSTRIAVAHGPGETRVAVLTDGRLVELGCDRPAAPDLVGAVFRGRITARVPAMAGAFVSLGTEAGFLPDSAGAAGRSEGAPVLVRVTRAAQEGKGPRLAALDDPAGFAPEGPPGLLRPAPSAVLRLAASFPEAPVAVDSPALRAALRPALGARLEAGSGFDEALEAELASLATPDAPLPGGGCAHIHPTPALTAIDLDAGAATAARAAKGRAQLAWNLAALPELARQIRLRALGGAILIDFAGMPIARRAMLADPLRAALAADPARPQLVGFTGLGLAEILRPRIHPPLHTRLGTPHAAALAALRVVLRELAARPGWSPALRCGPAVAAALAADPGALAEAARLAGRAVAVTRAAIAGWELG
ncbi:MAG: ribonuclease E/G [Acetobacteraceae bacterium]